MAKVILGLIAGVILSLLGLFAFGALSAHHFVVTETKSAGDFDTTLAAITESVEAKGWEIPTIYRLDKTMQKHGHDVLPVAVVELCHPDHAVEILKRDESRKVTSFMPCRLSVYQTSDGDVIVSRMNSSLMSQIFPTEISTVMAMATGEVEGILVAADTLIETDRVAAATQP